MLKKLLKYDLKYNYKILSVFYLIVLFFSILTRIFLSIDNSLMAEIIGKICSGTTISLIFSILINNIMRTWANLTVHVYKDESYLLHTLPITKKQIYDSKILSVIITTLTSTIVIIVSLFISYYTKENFTALKQTLSIISTIYNSKVLNLLFIVFTVIFLEIITMIQSGYNGLILGHMKNNNKMVYSILYGFISYMISQALTFLIIYLIAIFKTDIMDLFITSTPPSIDTLKLVMYIAIIIYIIYNVIYFILNIKLLSKGVNVD